jgi:LmbE family N-acetylglucosaminyl deacetylase
VRQVDTLVVVAYPDDETIYFGPWLLAGLAPRGDVRVVTDGNHAQREAEEQPVLRLACNDLVARSADHWDFLDQPGVCLPLNGLQSRLSIRRRSRSSAFLKFTVANE